MWTSTGRAVGHATGHCSALQHGHFRPLYHAYKLCLESGHKSGQVPAELLVMLLVVALHSSMVTSGLCIMPTSCVRYGQVPAELWVILLVDALHSSMVTSGLCIMSTSCVLRAATNMDKYQQSCWSCYWSLLCTPAWSHFSLVSFLSASCILRAAEGRTVNSGSPCKRPPFKSEKWS